MKTNLKRKTPLIALILTLALVTTAYAVTRYLLTKPATVDITILPNEYVIETYVWSTTDPITTLAFTGVLIEDDPSQLSTTVKTEKFAINKLDYTTGETYYLSIESDQVDLYWIVNDSVEYLEGELYGTTTMSTGCTIYIEGMNLSDKGRTDIEIMFLVGDGT